MSAIIATGWDFYTYLWQWYRVDMTHNTSKQDNEGHQISGFSNIKSIISNFKKDILQNCLKLEKSINERFDND